MCSMAHPPRNSAFSESQLPPGTSPWSSQFKSPSSFHFKFPSLNQVPQAPHMSSHFALDGSGPGHSGDPRNRTPPRDPRRAHRHGGFENLSPSNRQVFPANQSSEITIFHQHQQQRTPLGNHIGSPSISPPQTVRRLAAGRRPSTPGMPPPPPTRTSSREGSGLTSSPPTTIAPTPRHSGLSRPRRHHSTAARSSWRWMWRPSKPRRSCTFPTWTLASLPCT